jgi:hypothetical protein
MSRRTLFFILIVFQGNSAIQFQSFNLRTSYSSMWSNSKSINDSLVWKCLSGSDDSEGKFTECYCQERICFNLYCDFFETLNDGNCEKSNLKFEDLKLNENIVLIYNNAIRKEFKSMSRAKDLNSWSASNILQYSDYGFMDVVALKRDKNGKASFHLLEYCNEKQIKDLSAKISEWTTEHKLLPIAVNLISLSCFIVLLILFITIEKSRTLGFKLWMGYIVAGIIDYSLALFFAFNYENFENSNLYDPDDRDLLLDFFLYLYLCVEFAQIIWVTVVYFEGLLTFS